jgi:hypothetical protein
MMKIYLLGFIILYSTGLVIGKTADTDSLMEQRRLKYEDYLEFRNTMGQRTWINLVNLNNKAFEILKQDDQIIGILNMERSRISQLKAENEKLMLRISILEKEAEIQEMLLNDKKYYANVYLGIIGFMTLLFFVMLILFIDRQARYRSSRLELERIWVTGEHKNTGLDEREINMLKHHVHTLETERDQLRSTNETMRKDMQLKDEELEKTIQSKKRIESEIKLLIAQLKEKSSI